MVSTNTAHDVQKCATNLVPERAKGNQILFSFLRGAIGGWRGSCRLEKKRRPCEDWSKSAAAARVECRALKKHSMMDEVMLLASFSHQIAMYRT